MTDILKTTVNSVNIPQCQFFVVRKKRLCRMTVRPGRQYCGEHEPQPRAADGQDDTRIPCPNDPKHTCYASKLEKHLSICNARLGETPPYIIHNINSPTTADDKCVRKPLSEIPRDILMQVIDKVNRLYETHIEANITSSPDYDTHPVVVDELTLSERTERSRRHFRQASTLLRLAEGSGLVRSNSCYVELGAGRGQLSYFMGRAWCGPETGSRVLAVDRAALRHKRDNKLRSHMPEGDNNPVRNGIATETGLTDKPPLHPSPSLAPSPAVRLRADLAHLALHREPTVERSDGVVGFAKHLCGVAMDFALRCLTSSDMAVRMRGAVLATCCHHRCTLAQYYGWEELQQLGITSEEFNIILAIVSWATCGDGRSRDRRRDDNAATTQPGSDDHVSNDGACERLCEKDPEWRASVGRRAKAVVDWGRVLRLRRVGLRAQLCRYCDATVSPENHAIIVTRPD